MLTKLVTKNRDSNVSMFLVTLLDNDYFYEKLKEHNVKVYKLSINKSKFSIFNLFSIPKIIIKEKPDVIQTWMYHADFLGLFLKILFPSKKLVWNLRHSSLIKGVDKKSTILLAKILGRLSFIPNKIVCGSTAALNSHISIGYVKKKMEVVPNGFDTTFYTPNNIFKEKIREKHNISESDFIIGHVGRENKIKNQLMLIKAFNEVSLHYSNITLILVGKGLKQKYAHHPLVNKNKILIVDETKSVNEYLSSFDLFVLPSLSEGFPNVLGEAMASGVPCISSNVGDSARIIGENKWIMENITVADLEKKIISWLELRDTDKEELKIYSRKRIIELYSIEEIVKKYLNIYKSVI